MEASISSCWGSSGVCGWVRTQARGRASTEASSTCASRAGWSLSPARARSRRAISSQAEASFVAVILASRQALGFLAQRQLIDELIDLAVHHRCQVVAGDVDAVVGNPGLGVI